MVKAVMFSSDKGDLPFQMPLTNNLAASTDPLVTNDKSQGYEPGAQWLNATAGRAWFCISNAVGAAVWALDGGSSSNIGSQAAPVARDTGTTLTGADLLGGLITSNPAGAINLQLPLATAMDTAIGASAPTGTSVDFVIINTNATNADTITTNTGWTITGAGSMVVALSTSARFRARKTGAGAWTLYRIA